MPATFTGQSWSHTPTTPRQDTGTFDAPYRCLGVVVAAWAVYGPVNSIMTPYVDKEDTP